MRKLVIAISCFILVSFVACGESEKVIDTTPSEAQSASQNNGQNVVSENQQMENTGKGYVFSYDGTEVEVDADVSTYVDKFGEPASYYESPSCAFDNLDKFYTYHGFEIDTYYSNNKDLVLGIVLLDDTVSTTEGVCIGDTQDKVTSVYGEPTESTDNSATYNKGNMKLVFIFKDGAVASIEYKSLVLE